MVTCTKLKRPTEIRGLEMGKVLWKMDPWSLKRCRTKWHEEVSLQPPTKRKWLKFRNMRGPKAPSGGLLRVGDHLPLLTNPNKTQASSSFYLFILLRECNKLYLYGNGVQKKNKQPAGVDNKLQSRKMKILAWLSSIFADSVLSVFY